MTTHMHYDDDTLMAYADGELAPEQRAEIARAIARDPALAAAVARHQALRRDVFAAFAPILDEAAPQRLQPAPAAPVHDLAAARAARETAREARRRVPAPMQWGALAASLAVGVLAGVLGTGWFGAGGDLVRGNGGELAAGGRLAQALDGQLAGDGLQSGVRIGLSFASRDGGYCRSFQLDASAGLACRRNGGWRIPVLAEAPSPAGGYRQAAAELPPAVLEAVDARIAGSSLDAAAERAARARGWQAAPAGQP